MNDDDSTNFADLNAAADPFLEAAMHVSGLICHEAEAIHRSGEWPPLNEASARHLATYIRSVGAERALLPVLETELKLRGLIEQGASLSRPQQIGLKIFTLALTELDSWAAELETAEKARLALANATPPPPVPIEETTLETVDGPGDTWS